MDGKTIQTINTGVHWHILPDADYPIRDRYFRTRTQTATSEKPTIYDTLPSPIECLSRIAQYGFEQVCDALRVCRATIKKHLATANLPTSKTEIVAYYNHHILCKQPKKPISKGKIQQIDIQTGEVLHTFNNGYEAGRYLGDENKRKHINEVCLGKRNSAYGYK